MPERTSWRRGRDHLQHRARIGKLPVLLQAPEDVLDVDDGVVDELADGDGEAAERHRVDGHAEGLEHHAP